jgi:hypothetical protein
MTGGIGELGATYTEDDDEEEIDIGDVVKLPIQVLGDEAQRGIFGGSDLVPHELLFPMALLVELVGRQWHVDVDVSWFEACGLLFLAHGAVVADMGVLAIANRLFLVAGDADARDSVEDRLSLSRSATAGLANSGPSHTLYRLGDIASGRVGAGICIFITITIAVAIGVSSESDSRHN